MLSDEKGVMFFSEYCKTHSERHGASQSRRRIVALTR